MLEIKFITEQSLSLSGKLDVTQISYAESEFNKLHSSSVVDMAGLTYISSAGLGVLLSTQKRLNGIGQTLRLQNLTPPIRNLFRISGFDKIFELD